jgi:glycosyltransferase involved in cell wall biosynthesis
MAKGGTSLSRQVTCVYDAFDGGAFRMRGQLELRSSIRAQLAIPESAAVIAIAGRVCPDKRQDLLIEAARIGERDLFYLIVGGDPPSHNGDRSTRGDLTQRVAEHGLSDRVIFTGQRDDVSSVMMASELVVLASEEEAFGRVLLEGLSLGKYIVGPDAGGPSEIVGADERGLSFRAGDATSLAEAIRTTFADESAARGRTSAGAEWVSSMCSPRRHAAEIMRLYDEMGVAVGL